MSDRIKQIISQDQLLDNQTKLQQVSTNVSNCTSHCQHNIIIINDHLKYTNKENINILNYKNLRGHIDFSLFSNVNKEFSNVNKEFSNENKEFSNENKEFSNENKEFSNENKEFSNENKEFTIENNVNCIIDSHLSESYILNQLANCIIQFTEKFNHLLMRECRNVYIITDNSCISGIEMLRCSNITINSSYYNYLNLEYTTQTKINGSIDDNSIIKIMSCLDICVNSKTLLVNEYKNEIYTGSKNSTDLQLVEQSIPKMFEVDITLNKT
jgi:hypothetical protein